jgi:dTDP-4-amino-4,6-dideoxygalactose transaminase
MKYTIPLSYNPIDVERVTTLLRKYEGVHHNRIVTDFERELASFTGAKFVVALNSGTAAIHLGLIALGVQADDEVLVSDFTYVASINPILYLGAKPIFIDSEPETWNMDPDLLEEAIQSRLAQGVLPKTIIVVHVYGMPPKIKAICSIAEKYGIPVLEDAAEALGSRIDSEHVGLRGRLGIFSFNNNKIMTTYGGGALVTSDEKIYRKVLLLSEQAREDMPYYDHREIGFTYRMGPMNAAMGLSQIPLQAEFVKRKRRIFELYRAGLSETGAEFSSELPGYASNRWLTTVVWKDRGEVATVVEALRQQGIEVRYLWRPMHEQEVFRGCQSVTIGFSKRLFQRGLSLPSGNRLTDSDIEVVAAQIKHAIDN